MKSRAVSRCLRNAAFTLQTRHYIQRRGVFVRWLPVLRSTQAEGMLLGIDLSPGLISLSGRPTAEGGQAQADVPIRLALPRAAPYFGTTQMLR